MVEENGLTAKDLDSSSFNHKNQIREWQHMNVVRDQKASFLAQNTKKTSAEQYQQMRKSNQIKQRKYKLV